MIWHTIISIVTIASALVIIFTSFCRLTIMSHKKAKRSARLAFWMLSSVAWIAIFAFLVYGWTPDMIHAAIFSAIAFLHILSRPGWANGVPAVYRHGPPRGIERRKHPRGGEAA